MFPTWESCRARRPDLPVEPRVFQEGLEMSGLSFSIRARVWALAQKIPLLRLFYSWR